MTSATNGTNTLSFAYNADGLRTSKTVNGVVHNYYYADGKLVRETYGDTVLDFFYDASGYPYIMKMGNNIYYYITNAQGDVIRVVDIHGNTAAYYQYDPYGKVIHASGSHANINPLKYRAYLHDTETGLYYLQSRYYDPEVGRFLVPDEYPTTGQGLIGNNMFSYCGNNPVAREDSGGYFWDTVFDVVSLGFSIAEVCVNPADPWAWAGLAGDLVDLIPFVTGVGEATKAIKISVQLADGIDDVYDVANTSYKAMKKLDGSDVIKGATGSYEIAYTSGYKYVGKGNFDRALKSAKKHADENADIISSISWRSAPSQQAAFVDEYARQVANGYSQSGKMYNRIWSPGRGIVNGIRFH